MTRRISFTAHTSTIPDYFLNSLQDFLQSLASNFQVTVASTSSLKVAAGSTPDAIAAISIGGKWRFNTADATAAHPGGAAGSYDVFVTASDDSFAGTDLTTYSFGLVILASGSTPGTALYRKVATCEWAGSVGAGGITQVHQLVGGAPPPAPAGSQDALPAMDGAASYGSSPLYARADHAHPSDTSRAPLASPALTGTPTAPTAAVDTNSGQLATTAFVLAQAGSGNPAMDGAPSGGASARYARQDHVHPTDTSRAAVSSPTFTGTPAAPTAAVDTNTAQLATTAFVLAQASAAGDGTPAMDGAAARGTSTHFARADHVHPTDSSLAPLASPTLTGTPAAPTAAVDTSTTQLATTAFVLAQASAAGDGTPAMDGAAARGTSTHFARADHVHPVDTSRAPLASPTLTGTPAGPTAAVDTSTTQLATTAFVLAQASAAGDGTPAMDGAAARGTSTHYARADHVHPVDTSQAPLASPTFTGAPAAPTPATSDNSTRLATTAFVQAVAAAVTAGSVPSGVIAPYGGAAAPAGWLLCDGSAVSRTTYPTLFALLGTTYGAGNGSTTFNLPDLRGRVPAGKAAAGTFATLGAAVGAETHSITVGEMPSHDHGSVTSANSAGTPTGAIGIGASGSLTTGTESADHTHGFTPQGSVHSSFSGSGGSIASSHISTSATAMLAGDANAGDALLANTFTGVAGNTGGRSAAHTHSVPSHTHSVSFFGDAMGTHSHTISAQGGGAAMSLVQPSLVVNYIVKT